MAQVVYDDLENFNTYKEDFSRFETVSVYKTKYSIKIDYGKKKVFLSKGEVGEVNILVLISKVKNDARNYIKKVEFEKTGDNDIFWYYFNDESGITENKEFEVAKIDITAAYWTKAINLGIISKETVKYFNSLNFPNVKEKKAARLKALGSLATVKSVDVYNYGKKDKEFRSTIFDKDFRDLYMMICNEVAKDMQSILCHVNGIYYYWDCIFVDPKSIEDVGNLFNALGYKFTVEKNEAHVFKSKHISYICCVNEEGKLVQYPIN